MKLKKYSEQLKNIYKENGKRRICHHTGLLTERISPGRENDANSPGSRKN